LATSSVRAQPAPRHFQTLGAVLLAGSVGLALLRALTATHPAPPERLDPATRQLVGRAAAAEEPGWREKSRRSFPGDHWSQDDDTHNAERGFVIAQARKHRAPVADVLRAIDEDLRAHPPSPPRKAGAAICKPRPFYD
jgi:hypothetical protein